MAENAAATGLESHRIKSFKNKGRDAELPEPALHIWRRPVVAQRGQCE
ncbi:hypothetical protein Nmel_002580, partial [Mimus melanotis]